MWYSFKTVDDTPLLPKTINAGCRDVRKTRVESVFKEVFGYGSFVDPKTDAAVEKSNSQCDPHLRLTEPPYAARPGFVYRRFVDTRHLSPRGRYVDIRLPIIGQHITFAFLKERKELGKKDWCDVRVADPFSVLSRSHVFKVIDFCRAFGLDFGDLDILMHEDGTIYIIDVNNGAFDGMFFRIQEKDVDLAKAISTREAELFRETFLSDAYLLGPDVRGA